MQTSNAKSCMCMRGDTRPFQNGICLACQGSGIKNPTREAILRHNFEARRPSWDEYLAFDGAHCHDVYRSLPESWQCPGCTRTKFQIMRWTMLNPRKPNRHPGWAGGYHVHHDHAGDTQVHTGRPSRFPPRFKPTVICEQCNSADATAKKTLKLTGNFSFSPWEITQFVVAWQHGKHLIDYQKALAIYTALPSETSSGLFWQNG